MKTNAHKSAWVSKFEHDREYFEDDIDPFRNWENVVRPAGETEDYLIDALVILYSDGERSLADKFLSATISIVNRALSEDAFLSEAAKEGFPKNRGRALRARAYATALKQHEAPTEDLQQASIDYEKWCESYGRGDWDSQAQANYLNAVRLAFVGGDQARVTSLLGARRSFDWHEKEHDLYETLSLEIAGGDPSNNGPLIDTFTSLFDEIRNPNYKSDVYIEKDIVRLELAAIYIRFFTPGDSIDWDEVINVVSS